MRKPLDTDVAPMLDGSGTTVENRTVVEVMGSVHDGRIHAVVTETGRPAALVVTWGAVRVDEGIYYTAEHGGQPVIAFAPSMTAAKEHAFTLGNKKVGAVRQKELGEQLTAVATLKQSASEALSTGKGTEQQVKVAASELAARWANCGNTSDNLVRLFDGTAGLERLSRTTDINDPDTLLSIVDQSPLWEQPLLLDISVHNVHSFCLELHLDGGYLVQGYQGAYTAMWWEGFTDEPLMLPGMKTDEPLLPVKWSDWKNGTEEHRKEWGRGRKLSKANVHDLLKGVARVIVAAERGRWTEASHEIFVGLPFYLGQDASATVGGVMAVDITVFRLDHLAKALAVFGGGERGLSWALLNQIFGQMVTLAKA